MTLLRLLLNSLAYFWRGNLAVLLGVAVGCAVLTGALLVGDSLRGSLREQSERRLGWVEHALVAPRFFTQALAARVADKAEARVVPALMLQATVSTGDGAERREARNVTVLGVTEEFFRQGGRPGPSLSSALARLLRVEAGAKVTVSLQKPSALPREAALAKKEAEFRDWPLDGVRVLSPDNEGDAFNLRPDLEAPRNLFVPLAALQKELGLAGEVNALLAQGDGEALRKALQAELRIEDWGLQIRTPARRADDLFGRLDRNRNNKLEGREWQESGKPLFAKTIADVIGKKRGTLQREDLRAAFEKAYPYTSLESKQVLVPYPVARAIPLAAGREFRFALSLVHLAKIKAGGRTILGVVAALDPSQQSPLGPFLPPGVKELTDNQIILAGYDKQWPLGERPAPGAEVELRFKPPEMHGPAADRVAKFKLAGFVEMKGPAADPGLTPEFPGITDKKRLDSWELPFQDDEWKTKKIQDEYTEAYWDQYRATPKAYITLAAGQELWASRFGDVTSARIATSGGRGEAEKQAGKFASLLVENLKPSDGGFVFDPVRATSLEASQGGTPFGLLFLGFSFFLILASLLLVGLLYRLNLDRRSRQVGLLVAEGFPLATVRWLFLGEGGLLALLGVAAGALLALLYSRLLVQLLAYLWPGGVLKSFLAPHAEPMSFIIGGGGAIVVSFLTIALAVYLLGRVSPRALLAGQGVDDASDSESGASWGVWALAGCCVVLGVALLFVGPLFKGHEAKAGTFFGSGALFLTAGLAAVHGWMRSTRQTNTTGGTFAIAFLGVRNSARHPLRSMLTVGLLASAAFLIVAVESFRRHAHAGDGDKDAPDGGFALVGETHTPVVPDLNTEPGREEVLDRLVRRLRGLDEDERRARLDKARDVLKRTEVVGLLARAGDDASCLNLYKPRAPRILGVPDALIERGGFAFDAVEGNPRDRWSALKKGGEGKLIPAFGESNTVTWMLQKGLGGTLDVTNDRGERKKLVIAGLMHDSVFQSSLLISATEFRRLFPSQEAYPSVFLIRPPPGEEEETAEVLTQALSDWGMEVTPTKEKLEKYLAVENTYLTTFQALGGLGLVLGSLGVAVVLLRAVWERRAELALLRALGWRRAQVAWLVMAENLFLLLLGLVIGVAAAVLAVSPQLATREGSIPWAELGLLFAGVLATGVLACVLAVLGSLWAPIVPALRRE